MSDPPGSTCPACGQSAAAPDRFCGHCGQPLPQRCRGCGASLAATLRFCTACGTPADQVPRPVPPEDAHAHVAAPAEADAAEGDAGERRQVTVMFSDLSGYTALNERLDPEEVSQLMAQVRMLATRIVEAHGGIVNQVVGDEVMALFGMPQAGRDDPLRAVRAAHALRGEMAALDRRVAGANGVTLALHTGIHTGLVVVRPCDPHQGRFALTGDTVNTAARLLKLAEAGEVVVGESTWHAVMPHFAAEPLPATLVRGKREPVHAWRVGDEIEGAPLPPMVGRDDELQQAQSALRACRERAQARLIVIRGEAGIGKSRLLRALQDEAQRQGLALAAGQVPDFGPARAGSAWRQVALALLDDSGAAPPAQAIDRAVQAGEVDTALRPHLCALADVPLPPELRETYAQLDAPARELGTLEALAALARRRAAARGLMIAVEDTHWAEASGVVRLARLAAACRGDSLLLAVTTRPESADLDAARRAHAGDVPALTIDLAPLTDVAARVAAAHLAPAVPDVVSRCVERAGGNPLFLEQLLLSATEALRDTLPGSIQALVLARLDRLAPADKAAIQAASVLGRHFDATALGWLIDDPGYRFAPLLEAGLLRDAGGVVQFAHALIRDGAYESLLKSRRRDLHLRAAQWFEARDAGLHAEHLERAASPLAARAYLQACEAALARFGFDNALELARRGLALAQERGLRRALGMRVGETLRELGRNREALQSYDEARQLAEGDAELASAWIEIARTQRNLADLDGASAALEAAQPLADRLGDVSLLAQVHYLRGNVCFARGDRQACATQHERALACAREAGDLLGQAQALSGLGDAMYLAGRMRTALEHFTRSVELARQCGALRFAVMNRAMIGWCLHWCGDAEAALREISGAGADAMRLGHRNAQVMTEESLGMILNWMDRWDEGMAVNRRALALAREIGARRYAMIVLAALAVGLRQRGETREAYAHAAQSWALAQEIGAAAFAGTLPLVEMGRSAADAVEREELFARAEALLDEQAVSHCHYWLHADMIDVRLAEGRCDEALRHAAALERFAQAEPHAWATFQVDAARALVRHLADRERSPALHAVLRALHDDARRIGVGPIRAQVAAALAEQEAAAAAGG